MTRCIALGSPFCGVRHSWFFNFSPAAREMRPHSPFLGKLHADKRIPKPFFSLATPRDEVVPLSSTRLPGAESILTGAIGHVDLVISREVFRTIRELLP
jgi:hypothetical protein